MRIKTRKISEKQIKIIVVIAVIIIVVGVLFWGMIPEKIYEVSEISNSKESFDGKEFSVKGIINNWNISTNNFNLLDTSNENLLIEMTHTGAYPEGFGNGETIIASGSYNSSTNHFVSKSIQIGCPSKY
jgi:cytochrome c-type biogenesis protein CcmE